MGSMSEERVGVIAHYYSKIGVAVVEVTGDSLSVGETLRFRGSTTDFTQLLESMEIEHQKVPKAGKGSSVGIKVVDRVRPGDLVYRVS